MSLATVVDAAPVLLDETEARAITTRIRQCVSVALVEIRKAYEGRAWSVLGYESWADYCREEFGEHIRLPRDERQAAVAELRSSGMSTRAIAAATGVHKDTVRNDLSGGEYSPPADDDVTDAEIVEPTPIVGLDGKRYARTRIESLAERIDREESEAQYYREEALRKVNEKVGDVLFILANLRADHATDFATRYVPPAPPLTVEQLRAAAKTLDLLIQNWRTS